MKSYKNLKKVDSKPDFPKIEEKILKFWEEAKVFENSLKGSENKKEFVFFEGPPTMNGNPGIHHVISRAFKDLIPRYKTMQGFKVRRKAGWDTHGLPVELETERSLGISGKPQIEKLKKTEKESIIFFNQRCLESTKKYRKSWEKFSKRIGFWLDYNFPYITSDNRYIESLWWIIKQIWDRGLIYKDYKVVHFCPRCGTSLSSHEVAQGYQEITEPSLYVKFPLKNQKDTYILAWTTTPWTLPGNVALAINKDIDYIKVRDKSSNELYILAKARASILAGDYEIVETFKGKKLLGLRYEPLYKIKFDSSTTSPNGLSLNTGKKAHFICAAEFVKTDDGTGVVHTAVMYGQEDFDLGKKLGLPEKHTVDEEGRFTKEVKKFSGKFVFEANPEIVKDLRARNLLIKTENIRHSYPFCWRCDTKLIYYARESWYIRMTKLQKKLLQENQRINWIPSYLKEGRFGEWLRDVRDWAFSRERYWGTPLPIWSCTNPKCNNRVCIGSIDELSSRTQNPTQVILIRHGEAEHNLKLIYSCRLDDKYDLTKKGVKETLEVAKKLKGSKIAMVFASDLLRTKTSGEILAKELKTKLSFAKALREISLGSFQGKRLNEVVNFRRTGPGFYDIPFPKGESIADVEKRVGKFLEQVRKSYPGKTVALVTHEDVIRAALVYLNKLSKENVKDTKIPNAQVIKSYLPPQTELHRPYIDDIELRCERCHRAMRREPVVCDVWFDSGAMPFAQWHYPFENRDLIDKKELYPADYIAEAIDQTRGWFYTLLAIALLLNKERPYKNVISLGHILDKHGKKMSKSRGNIIKPEEMTSKFGADALRWYFFTINQPQDTKNFDPDDLQKVTRKQLLLLWNIYGFLITYSKTQKINLEYKDDPRSLKLIDRWVLTLLQSTTKEVKSALDRYDITHAARALERFTNLLSTRYLKPCRARFTKDRELVAFQVLYKVLIDLTRLLAPFIPFITEEIYQNLKNDHDPESVHLSRFPKVESAKIDKKLEQKFEVLEEIISGVLAIRATEGIKVRQPVGTLYIKTKEKLESELLDIVKSETNIKNIKFDKQLPNDFPTKSLIALTYWKAEIALDTKITPRLKLEGQIRELTRLIQETRKDAKLLPGEKVQGAIVGLDPNLQKKLKIHSQNICQDTALDSLNFSKIKADYQSSHKFESQKILIQIKR